LIEDKLNKIAFMQLDRFSKSFIFTLRSKINYWHS
jgi:hypothetical protein